MSTVQHPQTTGTTPLDDAFLARNNVTVHGQPDGPTVVFAHGFGCDQGVWLRMLPSFTDDHRVVLFDHVGAGSSDIAAYDRDKYSSLQGYAADLLEVCRAQGAGPVTVVAHSVAAMIAAVAAASDPSRFERLVLVAPSPCYVDDPSSGYVGGFSQADVDDLLASLDSNYYTWAATMAPMVMGTPESPELGEELTGRFCRTDPTIARDFARVTFTSDARAVLREVTVPTLVLQCSDDILAPPQVGSFTRDQLPLGTLVRLAATGHCPHVSAPAETTAAIRDFIAAGR